MIEWRKRFKPKDFEFLQFIKEQGYPVSVLDNCPTGTLLDIWYIKAYDRLSYSRNLDFGAGPIPLTEYRAFAETYGIPETWDKFVAVLQAIDVTYLSDLREEKNEVKTNG